MCVCKREQLREGCFGVVVRVREQAASIGALRCGCCWARMAARQKDVARGVSVEGMLAVVC